MQSVLSLPPRLPDTLLSLFRTSPHHHEAIISVSLYWWKTEISFFFSPAFYASLTSLLLLTRPWKFVNPPKPVLELLFTASSPLHPLPGAVWVSLLPPVAGRSHQCVGALGPPAAPWGRVGDTDGGRATKQRWVFGEQGAARSRSRMLQCRDSHCHLRESQRNA